MNDDVPAAQRALIAELRHWREVGGQSQKSLAASVDYTPSYVSKVEGGNILPSRQFIEQADRILQTGNALLRCWKVARDDAAVSGPDARHDSRGSAFPDDHQPATAGGLIVEHEHAELVYADGAYHSRVRRWLTNAGNEPVTQYLIRISVDRYPGDPERSNRLYRESPLTWEEIGLEATCAGEPLTWRAKHDRDAFKEIWLLLENSDGRFPLYPGQTTQIEYAYAVPSEKWGSWWQRAVRLPTRRLSMRLDMPTELCPRVWGTETSMTATYSAFPTPIGRVEEGSRTIFSWSTENPDLHTRYRVEWTFKADPERRPDEDSRPPSQRMAEIGIVQDGSEILAEEATPFALPDEAEDARRVVSQLLATMERARRIHSFAKGMGVAAPQIGIGRAAAVVQNPGEAPITLLNPRIVDASTEWDEQYEGCLSFFDVRGMVPRALSIEVEHHEVDGRTRITSFQHGAARLVAHEIDHLEGRLYRSRMRPGITPIPVARYRGSGRSWTY